ncbi:MAG: class I SAM-dependent methyltransferase [Candidatus Paceibacterota bacterium]|nr:MAG: class I SAM-dependent methyltransferase [Candidatus Paceibacterota bacterium]
MKKTGDTEIKKFWDNMAIEHKQSELATAPDSFYRQLEVNRIEDYLRDSTKVLDIGCGNGYSTIKFAEKFKKSSFVGVDYSGEMIKYARQAANKSSKSVQVRVNFEEGDVRELSDLPFLKNQKFDFIVSERCLINLLNWEEQKHSLLEMKKLLKKKGRIILCENTLEGLDRLNDLRKTFDLFPIKVRWHNFYMPEGKLISFSKKNFKFLEANNIGSLYYIISRVVYAKLAKMENKEPDYLHPINKIASQLPSIGEYSPNYIFILENK